MNYLGLIFEFVFLIIGVYIYLFSIGVIKIKDNEKAAAFRQENGGWMRYLGLALAAINLVNIIFNIQSMLTSGS